MLRTRIILGAPLDPWVRRSRRAISFYLVILDLAGFAALLLWDVRMVQTGVQRALGPKLLSGDVAALRDLKQVNSHLIEGAAYPLLRARGALLRTASARP